MKQFTVLALSGSLRMASSNSAMLAMAAACAPPGLHIAPYRGLGALPLFNPDLEASEPAAVAQLRRAIASAEALLIASPEYAHGISSAMKNALDWMVSTAVFVDKPVVIWNASPRATHALAALHETLTVMSARMVPDAGLSLLIKAPDAVGPPVNPDPLAMRHALLVLQRFLMAGDATAADGLAPTATPKLTFSEIRAEPRALQ
jgi:NAD(P)H-dependent FMN reductase